MKGDEVARVALVVLGTGFAYSVVGYVVTTLYHRSERTKLTYAEKQAQNEVLSLLVFWPVMVSMLAVLGVCLLPALPFIWLGDKFGPPAEARKEARHERRRAKALGLREVDQP